LFVKAPQGDSAEDQLLVQFQGMIAEYERAQILRLARALTRAGDQMKRNVNLHEPLLSRGSAMFF
jgi:hypothetical protein